jgi:hypothetical protein
MKEMHNINQSATAAVRPPISLKLLSAASNQALVGLLLVAALIAFELFNFDTTRYALQDLLGQVSFAGLRWATILAIAFCAIDFAGLVRFFTPDGPGRSTPNEVWYLMGAWMLGATMNALMTWWAVSLTLLNHELGNEVIGREQLLHIVPIFVAALVWLTRVLFIGAFSIAGGHIFGQLQSDASRQPAAARRAGYPAKTQLPQRSRPQPAMSAPPAQSRTRQRVPARPSPQRISQRPPVPSGVTRSPIPMSAQARARR